MAEWVTVAKAQGVPEGTMVGAKVGDAELLVAKVGGQYRAIGSVCTHQGGPLAEGELDGNIVTCPWHGGPVRR